MQPFPPPSLHHHLLLLQLLSLIPIAVSLTSPAPNLSITDLMSQKGCKIFVHLIHSSAEAADSFASNLASGLTAFCPTDPVLKPFLPRFNNLTAEDRTSLLLYHAIPIYYSMQMLQSNNGVVNSLATDGTAKNYNFTVQNDGETVTLQTRITTARITGTILDEDPVAAYSIDEVLEPTELFKPAETPAPAPAPAAVEAADAPIPGGKKGRRGSSRAPSPEGKKADDPKVGDANGAAGKFVVGGNAAAMAAVVFALVFC